MLGTRGGAGATTIATNLAWSFAETYRRHTILIDLDLQEGDAALQLDAQGEPIYGPRDVPELAKIHEIGLPYWASIMMK